jgi:GntR family transcriptional regulator, transcriptional repressor for pyruvate dehydrogenase complex
MEAREALEPAVAALAAGKVAKPALTKLRDALKRMGQFAAKNDFDAYFQADKAFHRALADAAGNALVASALGPLIDTMDHKVYREFTRHYYLKNVSDLQHVVDLHREILAAVEEEDGETARSRMVEHWTRMREIWEA